jgi:hypothetical protein
MPTSSSIKKVKSLPDAVRNSLMATPAITPIGTDIATVKLQTTIVPTMAV